MNKFLFCLRNDKYTPHVIFPLESLKDKINIFITYAYMTWTVILTSPIAKHKTLDSHLDLVNNLEYVTHVL